MNDKEFVLKAIEKAKESVAEGGFPAGAIVVKDGKIIGEGISNGRKLCDPTSHGEMCAIRAACKNLVTSDISGAVLYSSMQPCVMCLGASMWSGISKAVFACEKSKVNPEYYGGNYDSGEINKTFLRPLELMHLKELEEQSLDLVHKWEKSFL